MYWDIEAKTDKLTNGLKGSKAEVKGFGEQASSSMMETYAKVQLAQQAFDAIYGAMKRAYEFAREGADLEYMASKFDNLTASIGTTTDALMKDLRSATEGTVSDMNLMTSATGFMALGLADSHDEVVRLTSVAGQLGMDMNELVLTLTNQTTRRFDQLGVSVAGFDEKVQALEATGMSANDAFNEAFLQQAEEQIERVGSVTEESIGSFMRFEASIGNLAKKMQTVATPVTESFISTLTDGINVMSGNSGWAEILDDVNDSVGKGIPTYENYRQSINDVLEETGLLVDENGKLIATNIDGAVKLGIARKNIELLTEAEFNATIVTEKWDEQEKKLADQFIKNIPLLGDMADETKKLKEEADALKQAQMEYKIFLSGELGKENEQYAEDLDNLTTKSSELRDEIDKLAKLEHRTKEQEEELQGLLGDLDDVKTKIGEVKDEHDLQTKQILLNLIEQRLGIDGITAAEQDFLLDLAGNWGLVDDATVQAWEKIGTYISGVDDATLASQDFMDVITGLPDEINIKVFADFMSNIPSWITENSNVTMGGGGGGVSHNTQAGGGGHMSGESFEWGEYNRPEMFITPSSGQVVNAQQIVEAMRSSGVNMSGGGVSIDKLNVYTNSGVDAIQYSIERAKGYAQL